MEKINLDKIPLDLIQSTVRDVDYNYIVEKLKLKPKRKPTVQLFQITSCLFTMVEKEK